MVLSEGSSDLSRVTTSTRLIAVSIPNTSGIRANDWRNYRTSVDQVETWTGYNFFSNVSPSIQSVIESKVDTL
jgi:endonuclease G, mitochondrial